MLVLEVLLGDGVAVDDIDLPMGRRLMILALNRTFTLRFALFGLLN